jgi:hypothetical protein
VSITPGEMALTRIASRSRSATWPRACAEAVETTWSTGALSELPLALGKVFAKLGITSRSQLGSVMPSDPATV